jgi:hypothetical protein
VPLTCSSKMSSQSAFLRASRCRSRFCSSVETLADVYGAWREGEHDDLVLALCLAVWAVGRRSLPIDETLVANFGPFSIGREDLFTLDEPYFRW